MSLLNKKKMHIKMIKFSISQFFDIIFPPAFCGPKKKKEKGNKRDES